MDTHDITNKNQIRDLLVRGLKPGKTVRLCMFDTFITITLGLDAEFEDMYYVSFKTYYDFNDMISDLEQMFDALSQA